jgi:hypothetical protein
MGFQSYLPNSKLEVVSDSVIAQRDTTSKINDFIVKLNSWDFNDWAKFIGSTSYIYYTISELYKTSQNNSLGIQFENEIKTSISLWDNVKWIERDSTTKEFIRYKVKTIVSIVIIILENKNDLVILTAQIKLLKDIFNNLNISLNNNDIQELFLLINTNNVEYLLKFICSKLSTVLPNNLEQSAISTNLYKNYINKNLSIINTYISQDSNYNAKLLQQSLELTFTSLISIAEPYRIYTVPNEKNVLQTFKDLQNRKSLVESANDPNGIGNFIKLQIAKGLKNIDYNQTHNWKTLCETLSSQLINTFSPYGNYNNLLVAINNLLSNYASQKNNADNYNSIPNLKIYKYVPEGVVNKDSAISDANIIKLYGVSGYKAYQSNDFTLKGQILNYYDNNNLKKYVKIINWVSDSEKDSGTATLESTISVNIRDAYISDSNQSIYENKVFPSDGISFTKNNNSILDFEILNNTTTSLSGSIKYDSIFFENNVLGSGALSNNYNYWNSYKTNVEIDKVSGVSSAYKGRTSLLREGNNFRITKSSPLNLCAGSGHYLNFSIPVTGTYNVSLNIPTSGVSFWEGENRDIDFYIINRGITKLTNWSSNILDGDFTKLSTTHNFTNINNKFCIHFKNSSENNDYIFNSPFISKGEISGTIKIDNVSSFLNSLNNSNFYRTKAKDYFNFNRFNTTTLNFKSTSYFNGSKSKIKFSNTLETIDIDGTYSGVDKLELQNTGYEKKYYDIFFELLFGIFKLINNYAIAKTMVPEAFDPEELFNNDFKVRFGKEALKSFLDDLLEDSGLSFQEMVDKIQKDPRADMLRTTFPYDLTKEIEWKSGKFGDVFDKKAITKIKKSLTSVKNALMQIKNLLDAVRSFIEILDALITLAEDLLAAVLDEIINQLNKTIDSISSIGVYALPLWPIYQTKDWEQIFKVFDFDKDNQGNFINNDINKTIITGGQSQLVIPFMNHEGTINTKAYTNTFYIDLYQNNRDIIEQDSAFPPPYIKNKKNDLWGMLSPFRATTYNEFISNISKCFYDEDDKLDPKFSKLDLKTGKVEIWQGILEGNGWMSPGRPLWTSGNNAKVIVLAATFPAPADFSGGIKGFLNSFLMITETWEALFKYNTNLGDKLREIIGLPDEDFEKWKFLEEDEEEDEGSSEESNSGDAKSSSRLDDFIDKVKAIRDSSLPTLQEVLDKNRGVLYRTGEPPNFIGVSVGSLLSGPIYYLKNLVSRLKYFKEKDEENKIIKWLKSYLRKTDKKIKKIEDIVDGIDKIIDLIDKIMNISFTYLIIDSTGGVDDIMAQLESAGNFPNEDESQIILGAVLGYSAELSGFDMSSYFKSIEEQFKEEKNSLLGDLRIQTEEDGVSYLNKFFGGAKKAPLDFL